MSWKNITVFVLATLFSSLVIAFGCGKVTTDDEVAAAEPQGPVIEGRIVEPTLESGNE